MVIEGWRMSEQQKWFLGGALFTGLLCSCFFSLIMLINLIAYYW
jgi:hypothetical protein